MGETREERRSIATIELFYDCFAVLALRSYLANQRNLTEECCGVSDTDNVCSWSQCSKFLRTGSYSTSDDNHFSSTITQTNR